MTHSNIQIQIQNTIMWWYENKITKLKSGTKKNVYMKTYCNHNCNCMFISFEWFVSRSFWVVVQTKLLTNVLILISNNNSISAFGLYFMGPYWVTTHYLTRYHHRHSENIHIRISRSFSLTLTRCVFFFSLWLVYSSLFVFSFGPLVPRQ